jgi:hypothetical protein
MASRKFMEFAPSGFNSDVAPYTVPIEEYTSALNVRFVGSSAQRFGGAALIYTTKEPWIGAPEFTFTTLINGFPWLLYGGAWGVGVTDGLDHYNVTPAGWVAPGYGLVTGGTLNNIICFSHVGNVPFYWDGLTVPGSVKPLPGWPAATFCRILRPFRSHLFAGDILSGAGRQQDRVLWSDAAPTGTIPQVWTATAENQAGEFSLPDGLGAVSEMQPLHDFLMIYKQGAAYAASFVGRPYIYAARRMAAVVGAVSPNAVAVLRGAHVVISPGDVVRLDGANVVSLIDQRIRSALFGNVNANALSVACVVHYPPKSEVWVCLPTQGSALCNLAGVWNYSTNKWTMRQLPNLSAVSLTVLRPEGAPLVWETQTQAWQDTQGNWSSVRYAESNIKVIGASPGQAAGIAFDMNDLELGQPLQGSVERLSMPIGGTQAVKLVSHIYPRISGTTGTQVLCRIGTQIDVSDPISWGAERPVSVDSANPVKGLPVLAEGRFLSVRMRAYQTAPWTIDGFGVEFRDKGRF